MFIEEAPEKTTTIKKSNGHDAAKQFNNLLDSYEPQIPRRGEIVKGEVLKIEENLVIVDVGAKRDAVVPPQEVEAMSDGFLNDLDEGDRIPVYVIRTPVGDEELMVSLEKGQREKDWERAANYLDSQEVLELEVVGKNKGGLLVEFGRLQGFVPNSHVPALRHISHQQERVKKKSKMIESTVSVKVLEIDRQQEKLILSAKAARKEARANRLAELEAGQTVLGRVVNLVDYGAFVDLGGVTGLLHISELAWHHVDTPADVLEPGQEIEVLVTDVDSERGRVGLSRKALLANPWDQFAQRYKKGDLVEGVVTALVDFGAFVRLPCEIEGLVHISEMHLPSSGHPEDALTAGEPIIVRITNIDPDEERVGLSMRQVSTSEEIAWLSSRAEEQPALDEA